MSNLMIRSPLFNDVMTLRAAMDRLFDESVVPSAANSRTLHLPVDIQADDEGFTLIADLPGATTEMVNVTILDNTLTIKVQRNESNEQNREGWLLNERRWGTIERSFTLPSLLDANKAAADLKDGVLTLRIPKSEAAKPRTVAIKGIVNNN